MKDKIGFDCLCLLIEFQEGLLDPDKPGHSTRNVFLLDALNELLFIRLSEKQKAAQARMTEAKKCKIS